MTLRPLLASALMALLLTACPGPSPAPTPPANAGSFTASAASSTSITLAFSGVTGATGYTLERRTGAGTYTQIATPAAGATTYTDTGLAPSTTYTYRLKTARGTLSSSGVEASATTQAAPVTAPGDTASFTATATSSTSITLAFSGVTGATGYTLERRTGAGAYAPLATLAAGTTGYTDSGLAPGTSYTYRLRATGPGGSSPGVEASATTAAASGGTPGDARYTRSATVLLIEQTVNGAPAVQGFGTVVSLASPIPAPSASLLGLVADTCLVSLDTAPLGSLPGVVLPFPSGPAIDAGAALTVREGGASLASLTRLTSPSGGSLAYNYASEVLARALPASGLSLDIPGATFPAVSGATFPTVPPVALSGPANPGTPGSVTSGTTFTWTASGSGESLTVLIGSGLTATGRSITFSCVATDDGSFSLPADTRAALDANGFSSGLLAAAGRLGYRVQTQGDTLVNLLVFRSQVFAQAGSLTPR